MGVSTDGQICFGIKFEEGHEFPWDGEQWGGDIEDWWTRGVCGYKNPFEIFDASGNYLPHIELIKGKYQFDHPKPREEVTNAYYDPLFAFQKSHPVPVKIVNYCSSDYPMYMLAVPETCKENSRGFPEEFDPAALTVTDEQRQALLDFCKTHGIDIGEETPKWWLSSYWG